MARSMGGFDMGKLMRQAQDLQKNVAKVQEGLKERVVEAEAGSGMVKVQVNGGMEVVSIRISPEVVNKDDVEMLEDLILLGVQQGLKKAKELAESEMAKVTGGMLPPGFGM